MGREVLALKNRSFGTDTMHNFREGFYLQSPPMVKAVKYKARVLYSFQTCSRVKMAKTTTKMMAAVREGV